MVTPYKLFNFKWTKYYVPCSPYMKVSHKVLHSLCLLWANICRIPEFWCKYWILDTGCSMLSVCCLYQSNNNQRQDKRFQGNLVVSPPPPPPPHTRWHCSDGSIVSPDQLPPGLRYVSVTAKSQVMPHNVQIDYDKVRSRVKLSWLQWEQMTSSLNIYFLTV